MSLVSHRTTSRQNPGNVHHPGAGLLTSFYSPHQNASNIEDGASYKHPHLQVKLYTRKVVFYYLIQNKVLFRIALFKTKYFSGYYVYLNLQAKLENMLHKV